LRTPLAFGSLRAACAAGAALGGLRLLELRSVVALPLLSVDPSFESRAAPPYAARAA